jgi:nucleoside-diphosphate-sugar epimerase
MKTVLITGGGGYIGSVLTEMALDAGHRVRLLDRLFFGRSILSDLEKRDNLEICKEDVRYVPASVFEGVDVVMDLAGISNDPACDLDPRVTEEVNLVGPVRVARLAKEAGVERYIFSSSCSIYGQGQSELLDENSPKAPVSLYAKTKIDAEEQIAKLGDGRFSVTFLRNATAYGLSHRMRFDLVINIMTLYAYRDRRIYVLGGGKQWRPVVHVKDISKAFLTVMDAERGKVAGEAFNVGSSEQNYQVYQIAQMIRDVVPHTNLEMVPDDPDKRSYNVDFSKIARVLGYRVDKTPYEGIVEIKQALEHGKIEDTIRTRTVSFYRYLLDAEILLREVSYEGKVF